MSMNSDDDAAFSFDSGPVGSQIALLLVGCVHNEAAISLYCCHTTGTYLNHERMTFRTIHGVTTNDSKHVEDLAAMTSCLTLSRPLLLLEAHMPSTGHVKGVPDSQHGCMKPVRPFDPGFMPITCHPETPETHLASIG